MDYLEIIKNISIFLFAVTGSLGLLTLYTKIFKSSKDIQQLNKKIENEIKNLDNIEIENIKGHLYVDIDFDGRDERKKTKIQHKIKKLEREKKYILEQISIYKIFKR